MTIRTQKESEVVECPAKCASLAIMILPTQVQDFFIFDCLCTKRKVEVGGNRL